MFDVFAFGLSVFLHGISLHQQPAPTTKMRNLPRRRVVLLFDLRWSDLICPDLECVGVFVVVGRTGSGARKQFQSENAAISVRGCCGVFR